MNKNILIVEDEKTIAEILLFNIKKNGFDAKAVYDGNSGLDEALSGKYDLILLDLMLPGMDGFEICRRVREVNDTPIIMLTAREEEADKVMGLELGADDYMTKPFSINELLSRIKANIRRFSNEMVTRKITENVIKVGAVTINNESYEITKGDVKLDLTKKEYEVVAFLAKNLGKVYSREQLMEEIWGYDGFYGDMRTVDVTIARLRKKLEDNPSLPEYIQTKKGIGYFFAKPE
ncbi:MAG: response regulator transcription factor [Clostridia bacterium]|nr:response regulator transcription factor [Clostridia bacterium]